MRRAADRSEYRQAGDYLIPGEFGNLNLYAASSRQMKGSMSITVTNLTHHIVTLRRLHARVLEAEIELLRRAYGESIVEEAVRLADEAVRQTSQTPQELPPESDEHASAIAEALNSMMDGR